MELNRREFLKWSGAAAGGVAVLGLANPRTGLAAEPPKSIPLHKKIGESTTICPFCGVGCGFVVGAENGSVVNVEGDPEHPINAGGACAKGGAQYQLSAHNPLRLKKVQYRAPGSAQWEEKSWDWAITEIARRIKNTRDSNWTERDKNGDLVNRTEAVGCMGGASLDNEECYLLVKLMRALGLVFIEHQARI